ncbi:PIN domain-containing protein [Sinorhizobium meliloti]|nr:PIN domain-containing protein [Sinorhizobium meliloti]RVH86567.1 PIN domain-containing protein [Sinorhizobium meliloti]RVM24515.1 PIN domain-containing protein [Sinorhizobium meliloti]RVO12263.1 PIN domain-containing protein [Sinorhizobium meliloti]RVO38026.1 PIN domain-containing protein [Sinorhizobium meliloti]
MFANRFTAFVDACTLASALKRNLLLTLAKRNSFDSAGPQLFLMRPRRPSRKILADKDVADATVRASRAGASMEAAFEEAMVVDFDQFLSACEGLPDENDAHVVAAALKTQAAVIVTDNLRDFPEELLRRLNLKARSADAFIADTIALDTGRAVAAVRRMRERFRKPEKTADVLLLDMEANGLTETVDVLRPHILSL